MKNVLHFLDIYFKLFFTFTKFLDNLLQETLTNDMLHAEITRIIFHNKYYINKIIELCLYCFIYEIDLML